MGMARILSCAIIWMLVFVLQANLLQAIPSCYNSKRTVLFTKYWIPKEGTRDVDDNDKPICLTGPKTERLLDADGNVIAKVAKNTFYKCKLEGTCLLQDGRLVNLAGNGTDTKFVVLDRKKYPYGMGAWFNPLHPFSSVGCNDLPKFTKVFIKSLQNFQLPGGQIHNGCFQVDDRFSRDKGCHLDFFIVLFDYYDKLGYKLPDDTAAVVDSTCEILDYKVPTNSPLPCK